MTLPTVRKARARTSTPPRSTRHPRAAPPLFLALLLALAPLSGATHQDQILVSAPGEVDPGVAFTVAVALMHKGRSVNHDGISIALSLDAGPGVLGGVLTRTTVDGIATFPGVTLSASGVHVLRASGGGLSGTAQIAAYDRTPPVLTVPAAMVAEATSAAGAAVSFAVSALDAAEGPVPVACNATSGSVFPMGTTTVACNAADSVGNVGSASFTITVRDTTPPTIDATADRAVEATSAAGAPVTYAAPATMDLVDGPGVAVCAPASGEIFALGSTSVACRATDAAGNSAALAFQVVVRDTTAPVIAPASDVTLEATSAAGALVVFATPETSDAVDGPGTAVCAPGSATVFPLGSTSVACIAVDAAGNRASSSFSVVVRDTTAPVIDPMEDIIVHTPDAAAVVAYAPPATSDAVEGPGTAICLPAPGSTFRNRDVVTCTATDAAGNVATPVTFRILLIAPAGAPPPPASSDLSSIVVTGPHALPVEGRGVFVAEGFNAGGDSLGALATFEWIASTRSGPADVCHTAGGVTGCVTVSVLPGPVARIELTGPPVVTVGSTVTLGVRGYDSFSNPVLLAITQVAYNAPDAPGTYTVVHSDGGMDATLDLRVIPDVIARLTVSGPTTMPAGSTATFTLSAVDRHGNEVALSEDTFSYTAPLSGTVGTACGSVFGVTACMNVAITGGAVIDLSPLPPSDTGVQSAPRDDASSNPPQPRVVPPLDQSPEESVENGAPGPGFFLVVAAVALAGLWRRRMGP